jgi:hypothetical protein
MKIFSKSELLKHAFALILQRLRQVAACTNLKPQLYIADSGTSIITLDSRHGWIFPET